MRYLYSKLPKDKYLTAMKRKFSNPLLIFDERLTGFVIGPFFAAAHYQPYEWNRRITSECNRAWGFIKEAEGGLEICFLRGKGMLSPSGLVMYTLFCRLICLVVEMRNSVSLGAISWILSVVLALIACIASAITSSMTEAGEEGIREINKFLTDPENYYC